MNNVKELIAYREFLKTSILKEFRGKYKKSFLGIMWSFINPLLQLLVYSVVFSFINKVDIPYFTVFLVVALIPWNFFSTTVTQSTSAIVYSGGILKKVYFPREILTLSIVISNLLNFFISFIIIIAALFISGLGISVYIVYMPLVIFIQLLFTLGISFALSAITVYIRDLEYFISVIMMMWFYFCPIVYPVEQIPAKLSGLFNLNPMLHIINAYRDILYFQTMPDITALLVINGISIAILFFGYRIFKALEKRFAEEI